MGLTAFAALLVLIPPSVIMAIYALLTQQSIGRMFAAALIPGRLTTLPVVYPLVHSLSFDPIRFGIIIGLKRE